MILVVIVISLRTALVQDVVAKKVTMEMENVVIVSSIDLSYNDVKCGFEMLHEIGLALEKC